MILKINHIFYIFLFQSVEDRVVEEQKPESHASEPAQECDDNEVFGMYQSQTRSNLYSL